MFSDRTSSISKTMAACEWTTQNENPPFIYAYCECPVKLMADYAVTLPELTNIMAAHKPSNWFTPGSYCGSARLNCASPNCVMW